MAETDLKKLELRIARLEQLVQGAPKREAVDITAEEMKAYQKVRDVIAADYGEFCGINDCFRCIGLCGGARCVSCFVCARCINECICGPCGPVLGGLAGTLGRFSGLGG